MAEDYIRAYWAQTVEAVGARRVVLTHWDDFFRGLDQPLRALPYAGDDLDVTMRVLGSLARSSRASRCTCRRCGGARTPGRASRGGDRSAGRSAGGEIELHDHGVHQGLRLHAPPSTCPRPRGRRGAAGPACPVPGRPGVSTSGPGKACVLETTSRPDLDVEGGHRREGPARRRPAALQGAGRARTGRRGRRASGTPVQARRSTTCRAGRARCRPRRRPGPSPRRTDQWDRSGRHGDAHPAHRQGAADPVRHQQGVAVERPRSRRTRCSR